MDHVVLSLNFLSTAILALGSQSRSCIDACRLGYPRFVNAYSFMIYRTKRMWKNCASFALCPVHAKAVHLWFHLIWDTFNLEHDCVF